MDDDTELPWHKIVTLIFVIGAIIVLLLLVYMVFLMPILKG